MKKYVVVANSMIDERQEKRIEEEFTRFLDGPNRVMVLPNGYNVIQVDVDVCDEDARFEPVKESDEYYERVEPV